MYAKTQYSKGEPDNIAGNKKLHSQSITRFIIDLVLPYRKWLMIIL